MEQKKNKSLRDIIKDIREATYVQDLNIATGTYLAWGLFYLVFLSVGAAALRFIPEEAANAPLFYFLCIMLFLILLAMFGLLAKRNKIVQLLRHGAYAPATISKRDVLHDAEKRTKYLYFCEFTAQLNTGGTKHIQAMLPAKANDVFHEGSSVAVIHSRKTPKLCAENPPESLRRSLLSNTCELLHLLIAIAGVAIVAWALEVVLFSSLPADASTFFEISNWSQFIKTFLQILQSHPKGLRNTESLLLSVSLFVLLCALYRLLFAHSRKAK